MAALTKGFEFDSSEDRNASRPVSRVLSVGVSPRGMTIHLERPSPDASRNLPGRLGRKLPWNTRRRSASSLFGLAPGGVCRAAAVAGSAVRSCRTISPLRQARSPIPRYHFCGTVPGVAPAGRYPAPCFHGARTFLSRALSGLAAAVIRPAGRCQVGAEDGKVKLSKDGPFARETDSPVNQRRDDGRASSFVGVAFVPRRSSPFLRYRRREERALPDARC